MRYDSIRREICDVCHKLWQRGIVAANDGNVSVKADERHYICTPSGVSKHDITPEMLVVVNEKGEVLTALRGLKPSTEMKMHFRCYEKRPDVRAVVHAHPPVSTSFASMGRALDEYVFMESIVNLGAVPVAPYAAPSTSEVPDSITPFLDSHDAILMANHGALTLGESLKDAYFRMETLEQTAKMTLYTHLLGGAPDLPRKRIDELLEIREHVYHSNGHHPGYVKYNKNEE